MARSSPDALDPAADAAALLRRLGFAIAMLLLPAASLVTRRAVVVLAPIAVILLVIAAVLDGAHRPIGPVWRRIWRSHGFIAGALALTWALLSISWTPFPGPAFERLGNLLATVGFVLAGYLALPDRMRSANLYLLPVGLGAGALIAVLLELWASPLGPRQAAEEDWGNLERGVVVLSLLVWPAVAWLGSRGRRPEALGLAGLVAIIAISAPRPFPAIALAAGAGGFALTRAQPRLGVGLTVAILPGSLALAPVLPFLLDPLAAAIFGADSPIAGSLEAWRRIVSAEPFRLVTGHGLETALRGRLAGHLPPDAPRSLLFELWYELGIVGALATAAALLAAILRSSHNHAALVPGMMAAFATAFAFAGLGMGLTTTWWIAALAVLVLLFVTVERGQFRTTRPKASLIRAAEEA